MPRKRIHVAQTDADDMLAREYPSLADALQRGDSIDAQTLWDMQVNTSVVFGAWFGRSTLWTDA